MQDSGTQKVVIDKLYCPKCYRQFESSMGITHCPEDNALLKEPCNCPLIGKTFADRYVIESVLGLGGMSIVYKARHKLMDRVVAIKMLHNNLKDDVTALERFRLEAQAASSLSHPNVITVYDFGVTPDGDLFFVMDCLEGENLKDLIERKGHLTHQRALPIYRQICDGLEAAHKKGIVHRDLKPANVVLIRQDDGTEVVKLVDFGIAKMLPQSGKGQQQLTKTGEVFGSPIYMSPEQCLGKELDTRSDIYALGCLMYEGLAGDPPFIGSSFLETMNMHVGDKPRAIQAVNPEAVVPAALESIILKCIEKKPTDRYQTVGEVRDVIANLATELLGHSGRQSHTSQHSGALPTLQQERTRNVALLITSGLALLFVGFIGFISLYPGPADDRGSLLSKMLWQLSLADGERALAAKDYANAQSKLTTAVSQARNFGDGKVRLQATLRELSELYNSWDGHTDDLEKANSEITSIDVERLNREFQAQMAQLDSIDSGKGFTPASLKLRAEAATPALISLSSKLYGRSMLSQEEQLLTKALQQDKKLLGVNSDSVAQLESKLADSLIGQRKYPQVRPLLVHNVEVRAIKSDVNPADWVRALSRLGQYDLDQSNFVEANKELSKALAEARKLKEHKDILVLCLRSHADYFRQVKNVEQSQKLLKEAESIESTSTVATGSSTASDTNSNH